MKTFSDCVPCFLNQALAAARMATDDTAVHDRVLREVASSVSEMDFDTTPPAMGQEIHRIIRRESGVADPYADVKERFNALALGLYDDLKDMVARSSDRFETAIRLAMAGNIIDFGAAATVTDEALSASIRDSLMRLLDRESLEALRDGVRTAGSILYLCDNAGEIVFDRVFIEELPRDRVTAVVRGAPVINDATLADAERVGLTGIVRVIDNGSDAPGTILSDCSDEFRKAFEEADVVIAKGQGNYETLSDAGRPVFYVLRVKCPVIARDSGFSVGSCMIARHGSDAASQDPGIEGGDAR